MSARMVSQSNASFINCASFLNMEALQDIDEEHISCLDEFPLGRLPRSFVREFGNLIDRCVVLRDPNLNEIEVRVVRRPDGLYFEEGWPSLRRIYNIWFGGWVAFTYVNPKLLAITVRTRWESEVKYPLHSPPLKCMLTRVGNNHGLDSSSSGDFPSGRLFPKCFVRSYFKQLTCYDVQSGILFGVDDGGEFCCKVSGGWSDFCKTHHIREGQSVRFAVTEPSSNYVLYVCVYPQIGLQTTLSYPLSDGTHLPIYVSQQYFVADY
ncbi:hypothetical protein TSUD_283090 [Trifolium subterraneum]|uniref:TF-B3 domain-containing protein n=1 Tax=Trifolium subterraneum TaxID=3900 RepID=A0A2Z6NFI8_TRISU|nr:hypothetical protein TSUD_283090 [Trifolium subterraneum]